MEQRRPDAAQWNAPWSGSQPRIPVNHALHSRIRWRTLSGSDEPNGLPAANEHGIPGISSASCQFQPRLSGFQPATDLLKGFCEERGLGSVRSVHRLNRRAALLSPAVSYVERPKPTSWHVPRFAAAVRLSMVCS